MTLIFSAAIFLGATLLFLVQPMVGKLVLPKLGGSPAVWTTCMLFFQATLLAGYIYAHLVGKLPRRVQAAVHALALLTPAAVLPFALPTGWTPPAGDSPVGALLWLLVVMAALPVVAVSTTGPLMQRWFSLSGAKGASDPYFLFVASNIGSFTGLLAYPFLVEPLLPLAAQGRWWAIGYAVYAGLVIVCGVLMAKGGGAGAVAATAGAEAGLGAGLGAGQGGAGDEARVTWRQRVRWLALAMVPTSLMLGMTQFVSTDVASMPLLWVLPLSAYLLTFVIAFWSRNPVSPEISSLIVILLTVFMVLQHLVGGLGIYLPIIPTIGLHLILVFFASLMCHSLLARERPPASRLTEFYLLIAVGGVLGGAFNSLVAPQMFNSIIEYPLALVGACMLRPAVWARPAAAGLWGRVRTYAMDLALPALLLVFSALVFVGVDTLMQNNPELKNPLVRALLCAVIPLTLALLMWRRPVRLAMAFAALFLVADRNYRYYAPTLYETRTFFGVHRVNEERKFGDIRGLLHGTTIHGIQLRPPGREMDPAGYYHPTGPIGSVFKALEGDERHRRIGILGMGTAGLAAYGREGDHITFFEIDPAVVHIARDATTVNRRTGQVEPMFSFLRDTKASVDIVLGDGRLTIARAREGEFGVMVMDAFSSDAVPAHLLTVEAVQEYFSRCRPDGWVVFNISNRYLALEPVFAALIEKLGLAGLTWADSDVPPELKAEKYESQFIVLARKETDLAKLKAAGPWRPLVGKGLRPWTDDYSNMLAIIRR
jgi:hypothetical protein